MFFLWVSLFGGCDLIKSQHKNIQNGEKESIHESASKKEIPSEEKTISEKGNNPKEILSQNKKSQTDGSVEHSKNIKKIISVRRPFDAVSVKKPLILRPEHDATLLFLRAFLEKQLENADEPWKLAHAILALGKDAKLKDGSSPIEAIFKKHAHWSKIGSVDVVQFEKFTDGRLKKNPVEPHRDLLLKVMTELHYSAGLEVVVEGVPINLEEYYNMRLYSNYLLPAANQSSYSSTNDLAWSLQALSTWAPEDLTWKAHDTYAMSMDDFVLFAAVVLEKESKTLIDAMKSGAGFTKDGKGIFSYTCGGSHLLQAVAHGYGMGFGGDRVKEILEVQNELLYYRFVRELNIYDQLMKSNPDYKQVLLLQRLKFVGHFLESVAKMIVLAEEEPRPKHLEIIQGAADQLTLTVEALRREGLFLHVDRLRTKNHQQHLDLIGDAAHAVYGLELISAKRSLYLR